MHVNISTGISSCLITLFINIIIFLIAYYHKSVGIFLFFLSSGLRPTFFLNKVKRQKDACSARFFKLIVSPLVCIPAMIAYYDY